MLHHDVQLGRCALFRGRCPVRAEDVDPAGFLVHGEIGKRYAAMGWETGPLGLPTCDEKSVAGTDNITQTFEHGRLTWSPTGVVVTLEQTESKGK